MSVYGIYKWKRDATAISSSDVIIINRMRVLPAVISSVLAFGVFLLVYFGLSDYTNAEQPLLDALVTSLSLLATYWLGNSWIGQWWVWVLINILSVIMFWRQNLYPTAFLYAFYGVSAVYGYYYWRKEGLYRNNL
ncbi:MAG: nicotinamide mononucleotide transporter [Bacteroidales bacterium]|nr:nicotinamide mononucleotide transporter [Bacteroidales bacterium]